MRLLRRLLTAVVVLLVLLVGLLGVLRTEAGGGLAARLAMQAVPGLRLEGLRLDVPWGVSLEHLELADAEGVWLTVYDARLEIAPAALWHREARITELTAARLAIARAPVAAPGAEPAPPATQVLPALPHLPLAVALQRLAIARLEFGAPLLGQTMVFEADGEARLEAGKAQARLGLDRLNGVGTVRLDARLAPAEDRLRATFVLREDGDGLIPAALGRRGEPVALDLTLDGPAGDAALRLDAKLGEASTARVEGRVAATPDGAFAVRLTGSARPGPLLPPAQAEATTPLRLDLDAGLDAAGRLSLRDARLSAALGRLTASGSVDLPSEALDLVLEASLADGRPLAALLPAGLGWEGLAAKARVGGTLAAPKLEAELRPKGLRTGQAALDAALGPAPVLTARGQLPGPEVNATLNGAAATAQLEGLLGETLNARLRLDLPRIAALEPGAAGALSLEATATGPRDDPQVVARIDAPLLVYAGQRVEGFGARVDLEHALTAPAGTLVATGRLEGLALRLDVAARQESDGLRITKGAAKLGPAELALAGVLEAKSGLFDGAAALRVDDLAPFGGFLGQPDLAGVLDAEARLAPRDGVQGIEAKLRGPRLRIAGQEGRITASATGTLASLALSLDAAGPMGAVTGQARLAQGPEGQSLEVGALNAQTKGQTLRLLGPLNLRRNARGDLFLAPASFGLGDGKVQLEGSQIGDRLDIRGRLTALPLALAEPFLPEVAPRGTISGDVRLTGTAARPEMVLRLTGSDLAAAGPAYRGLPKLGLKAEARLAGGSGEARAAIDAGAAGQVVLTAQLPAGFGASARIAATAEGRLDLGVLTAPFLAAGADRVSGGLRLALRAEGTRAAPRLAGEARLEGVGYRNDVTGLRLTDIVGVIRGEGERLRLEGIEARIPGSGTIALAGTVSPFAAGLPADLRLTARKARPAIGEFGTVEFDADLTLRGPALGAGLLAGEVRIARADIRVPESLPTQVPSLAPIRYIGTPPPGVELPASPRPAGAGLPPLGLALRILAPDEIFIRGRGIDVELGGEITLGGTLAAPRPSGGFRLRRGQLDILARRLEFKRGTIAFRAGSFEPELDLLAQAVTRGYTISVAVEGSPSAPNITLTSSPELPQDEVMAQLLFNRTTSNLSPFEIAQIAQAIGQLTGIGGGFDPLGKARALLGLDRLGVGSAAEGQTGAALEAGKYVAPGVYVGVRQGMQGGQTGVNVQLELAPTLKLEGQTATGPAGDRLGITWEYEY